MRSGEGLNMEAACPGPGVRLDTLAVKSTLLAVTAGPHTVQSVSRFHTFTRTIAIVKWPQDAEASTGRGGSWKRREDFFASLHLN